MGKTISILAETTGKVWKILCAPGTKVEEGETLMLIESMKMEIPVEAPAAGTLQSWQVSEDDNVQEGDEIAILIV